MRRYLAVSFDPVVQKLGRVTPEVSSVDLKQLAPAAAAVGSCGGRSAAAVSQLPASTLIIHNDRNEASNEESIYNCFV